MKIGDKVKTIRNIKDSPLLCESIGNIDVIEKELLDIPDSCKAMFGKCFKLKNSIYIWFEIELMVIS